MTTKTKITIGKTKFRSTYADSNALWLVTGKKGKDCYLCQIQNEPIEINGKTYDGDYAGTEKVFMRDEILKALHWENYFDQIHDDCAAFYNSLRQGQIVHYHNGFGNFVRCEVTQDKKLKPLALVGSWKNHDLSKRLVTGEIVDGYWCSKIKEAELMNPNATNIWEFYEDQPDSLKRHGDPTTMQPINLDPPEMTSEQQQVAKLWQTVNKIRNLTENEQDPQTIINRVVEFVKQISN